jgi:hypothetical protein
VANAGFRGLILIALPVLAVLLAAYVTPSCRGRLVALVAMVEYLILFFGLITLLTGCRGLRQRTVLLLQWAGLPDHGVGRAHPGRIASYELPRVHQARRPPAEHAVLTSTRRPPENGSPAPLDLYWS